MLLGLMFLMTMVPIVLAEDISVDTNIDANITQIDEREARSMLSPFGSEVRMLQLEKSVTRNVLIGNIVLQVISDNNTTADITNAENTLNTMEMLLEEIKNTPTEGDKNVLVQTFVELKKEARTLSANFRTETKDLITSDDRREIMEQVREIDRNQFNELSETIKEKVKNFNAEKMKEKFNSMGIKNENMINRIRNGDANLKEIREYALSEFKDFNSIEKKRIASQMKNDSIKRIVQQKQITQKVMQNLRERLENSIQNRNENLNDWLERKGLDRNLDANINRMQRLENQSERIQEMLGKMQNRNGGRRQ